MAYLEVRRLRKSFGSTAVLDDVSFAVAEGECLALLGPSGCGKTTTLRSIAGLEEPSGGEIELDGLLLNGEGRFVSTRARRIGMVFQSFSVWPHLTVFENVAFGLRLLRVREPEIRRRVAEMLDMVRLVDLSGRRSAQLSGGQLQRVALARTLVVEPKLVLFDEPLSNLDAKLRVHMRVEIRSLLKRLGMSAVYVTHDQQDASIIADRTAIMNAGRIEQIGTWEDLYFSPVSTFVAGFMSADNTLCGRVVEVKSGCTSVVVEGIGIVAVATPPQGITPRAGDDVAVYFPREALVVSDHGTGQCAGTIEAILPNPGFVELTVAFGGGRRLTAVAPTSGERFSPGQQYGIGFDPRYLRLLPQVPA